jgi:hypothetical protein
MKAGDLVAFSGRTFVSDAINIATYGIPRWSASHVGILAEYDSRLLLFEATTLDTEPCEIQHQCVAGVQAHKLDVIARYDGKVWLYPLYRNLYDFESCRLTRFLVDKLGTPYDDLGALRSAGVGLSWIESRFRTQDLSSIFCSEMVAAAYSNIGIMPSNNVSRWSPNRLVRYLYRREILRKPECP